MISTYVTRSQFLDVVTAIIAGGGGYFMKKYGFSTIPFLVAFILSPIAEKSFYQALLLADGSYWTFALRPISGALLAVSILVLVLPPILKKFRKQK